MLLLLIPKDNSYREVTRTTITWRPIRVLASKTNGWHDIGIWVAGGGIHPGYEARLRFDGKKYSNISSVPQNKRTAGGVPGRLVIPSEGDGTPLYP